MIHDKYNAISEALDNDIEMLDITKCSIKELYFYIFMKKIAT